MGCKSYLKVGASKKEVPGTHERGLMSVCSKGETKSKVTKSARFGGGRWQVCHSVAETIAYRVTSIADSVLSKFWYSECRWARFHESVPCL